MKRGRGKEKGGAFERKICKRLTLWASGCEKPLWYWRIGSSGAQATLTKDDSSRMVGDLVAITQQGAFLTDVVVCEMKDDKRANILDFLKVPGRKHHWIRDVWENLQERAAKSNRYPWLIFHRYGTRLDYIIASVKFYYLVPDEHIPSLFLPGKNGTCFVAELESFLTSVRPWDFARAFLGSVEAGEVARNYAQSILEANRDKDCRNKEFPIASIKRIRT
jgi:hypothetical protein